MLKVILWGAGILVVVAVGLMVWIMQGPDLSKFKFLENPRIVQKPDAHVLEVPFETSSQGLPKAFGVLMQTYYQTPGTPKGPGMSAPVARYENQVDLALTGPARAQAYAHVVWKGTVAIPVPVTVTQLPAAKNPQAFTPQLGTWNYGEVAEILHYGPYDQEPATIKRLMDYIQSQGYEICGRHEEEYLRGPGMPFSKPQNYVTILRYQVRKKAAADK